MLQISRHPGRQLNDLDASASWSASDPSDQGSAAFKAVLGPQFASAGGTSGSMGSQGKQQPTGNSRHGTMDEWADCFDQCKTSGNGTEPNQGSRQQDEPQAFANHMAASPGSYPGPTGPFETLQTLNHEEAEDCMFGESDDEGPHVINGAQRLPYFGAIADWPIRQMPHLPVSQ